MEWLLSTIYVIGLIICLSFVLYNCVKDYHENVTIKIGDLFPVILLCLIWPIFFIGVAFVYTLSLISVYSDKIMEYEIKKKP